MIIKSNPVVMRHKNRSGLKLAVEFIVRQLTPEDRSVLDQGLRMLGLEQLRDLPGIDNLDMVDYFLGGTRDLLARYGSEYITQHRQLHLDQLEYLATLL
jgi:hypothetical protein